jgi:hypothetical protein
VPGRIGQAGVQGTIRIAREWTMIGLLQVLAFSWLNFAIQTPTLAFSSPFPLKILREVPAILLPWTLLSVAMAGDLWLAIRPYALLASADEPKRGASPDLQPGRLAPVVLGASRFEPYFAIVCDSEQRKRLNTMAQVQAAIVQELRCAVSDTSPWQTSAGPCGSTKWRAWKLVEQPRLDCLRLHSTAADVTGTGVKIVSCKKGHDMPYSPTENPGVPSSTSDAPSSTCHEAPNKKRCMDHHCSKVGAVGIGRPRCRNPGTQFRLSAVVRFPFASAARLPRKPLFCGVFPSPLTSPYTMAFRTGTPAVLGVRPVAYCILP